VVQAAVNLVA